MSERLPGILLVAASLAGAMPCLASAAGLASTDYYAPVRYLTFNWAGPYAGATLGYEWGSVDNNPTSPKGVAGGLDAGFNWQSGSFVYGGETEISFPAAEDTFAPWQFSNPWFGTLRGRAGIAFNNVLLFGTAGLAYGEMTAITSGNSESHRSLGWVAGLGAELSFAQHWSAKAEWIYFDLDDRHFSATTANNGLCRQSGAARAQLSFLERWKCQASLQSFAADFPDRVTFARAPQSIKISLTKFLVCNSLLTKMMTRVKRFSPQ